MSQVDKSRYRYMFHLLFLPARGYRVTGEPLGTCYLLPVTFCALNNYKELTR